MVVVLLFFNSLSIAQYRRGHTDITGDLARMLRQSKPQDYYFSLLPPDLNNLVCTMSSLDVSKAIYGQLMEGNREIAVFLASLSLSALRQAAGFSRMPQRGYFSRTSVYF